jgi:hypothetical protein
VADKRADAQRSAAPGFCLKGGYEPGNGFVALGKQNLIPSLNLFDQVGKLSGPNF